jgi:hypothetical protein
MEVRRRERKSERNIEKKEGKKERNIVTNNKVNNLLGYETIPSHLRKSVYAVPNGRTIVNDRF